jgi:hypothetical protein
MSYGTVDEEEGLNHGRHIRAPAPLRNHGRGRRPGPARTQRKIMIAAIYVRTSSHQTGMSEEEG